MTSEGPSAAFSAGFTDSPSRGLAQVVLSRRGAGRDFLGKVCPALLAVVGPCRVYEAAFGAMQRHGTLLPLRRGGGLAGQNFGELFDVFAGDRRLALFALRAHAVDELGAKDVDLAVKDAALIGDLALFVGELADQFLQLDVCERAEVREGLGLSARGLVRFGVCELTDRGWLRSRRR